VELAEVVDEVLGAADGEGGDEDLAVVAPGLGDDLEELLDGVADGAVVAVAVGGLEDDGVGVGGGGGDGVAQEGGADAADVGGEDDDLLGAAPGADADLEAGGAEDVAGVGEADADAVGDLPEL